MTAILWRLCEIEGRVSGVGQGGGGGDERGRGGDSESRRGCDSEMTKCFKLYESCTLFNQYSQHFGPCCILNRKGYIGKHSRPLRDKFMANEK